MRYFFLWPILSCEELDSEVYEVDPPQLLLDHWQAVASVSASLMH